MARPSVTPVDPTPDLLVVGAGLVGLATSREAARRGASVLVLDRGSPGSGASGAAAGMLSPLAESPVDGPFLDFALHSLRLWPRWVRELEEETGLDLQYEEAGKLLLARTEEERDRLLLRIPWATHRGLHARWVPSGELEEAGLPPRCGAAPLGALELEEDHRLDNRMVVQALRHSAEAAGVRILEGTEARGLLLDGGRCLGVQTDSGPVRAARTLLAAGAWTSRLEALPLPIPVHPVRGQMVSLAAPELAGGPTLEVGEIYLVPRADGRVLAGATVEPEAGFDARPDAGGLRDLLGHVLGLLPSLASAPVLESWAGLRPGTPDGLPILGPLPGARGAWVATGHFRNGVLLTPVTAESLTPELLGEARSGGSPPLPPAFSPRRFQEEAVADGGTERPQGGS